jgi:hypothetical protein
MRSEHADLNEGDHIDPSKIVKDLSGCLPSRVRSPTSQLLSKPRLRFDAQDLANGNVGRHDCDDTGSSPLSPSSMMRSRLEGFLSPWPTGCMKITCQRLESPTRCTWSLFMIASDLPPRIIHDRLHSGSVRYRSQRFLGLQVYPIRESDSRSRKLVLNKKQLA